MVNEQKKEAEQPQAATEETAPAASEPQCYDFEGIVRALAAKGWSGVIIDDFTADPETGALVGKVKTSPSDVIAEVRLNKDRIVVQSHSEI